MEARSSARQASRNQPPNSLPRGHWADKRCSVYSRMPAVARIADLRSDRPSTGFGILFHGTERAINPTPFHGRRRQAAAARPRRWLDRSESAYGCSHADAPTRALRRSFRVEGVGTTPSTRAPACGDSELYRCGSTHPGHSTTISRASSPRSVPPPAEAQSGRQYSRVRPHGSRESPLTSSDT